MNDIKFCIILVLIIKCEAFANFGTRNSVGSDNNYGNTNTKSTGGQPFKSGSNGQGFDSEHRISENGIKSLPKSTSGPRNPITIAVQTRRTIEVIPVPSQREGIEPHIIEITSNPIPLQLHFRSQSSRLIVRQSHSPSSTPQRVEETTSEDEPYRLSHEVIKPVIQEVREVIQPYRKVIQQIRPVIEDVNTIISAEEEREQEEVQTPNDNFGSYKNLSFGSHKNSNSGRSSYSGFSDKNFDSSISQKAIDSDLSQTSDNFGSNNSGYSASERFYRIDPLIYRRHRILDQLNRKSDGNQRANFNIEYIRGYPTIRFYKINKY